MSLILKTMLILKRTKEVSFRLPSAYRIINSSQRAYLYSVNLGKWVLRYLFANVITEEIQRDQAFRKHLLIEHQSKRLERANAPESIQLPALQTNGWHGRGPESATTPKALNGVRNAPTPGLGIAMATPAAYSLSGSAGREGGHSLAEDAVMSEPPRVSLSQQRKSGDYFSVTSSPNPATLISSTADANAPTTPVANHETDAKSPVPDDARDSPSEPKDTPSKLGKRFRMNMSFGIKKLGRAQAPADKEKAVPAEVKVEEESDTKSEKSEGSREVDDNLLGTIQKLRFEYRDILQLQAQRQYAQDAAGGALGAAKEPLLDSLVTPSMPSETPVLKPPAKTTLLIQEDRPEAGGVADLFEGTVGSLRDSVDLVERVAPMWLGDVLLRNLTPFKEMVKVGFTLDPWQGELPPIGVDG